MTDACRIPLDGDRPITLDQDPVTPPPAPVGDEQEERAREEAEREAQRNKDETKGA